MLQINIMWPATRWKWFRNGFRKSADLSPFTVSIDGIRWPSFLWCQAKLMIFSNNKFLFCLFKPIIYTITIGYYKIATLQWVWFHLETRIIRLYVLVYWLLWEYELQLIDYKHGLAITSVEEKQNLGNWSETFFHQLRWPPPRMLV